MPSIDSLMHALDEITIVRQVGSLHDDARREYVLRTNTVSDFNDFTDVIGDYLNYHYARCVSRNGQLSRADAQGMAKSLLENAYRRRRGNIVSAFNDAHQGTNGGLRVILDTLADALKAEAIERYIRGVFDQHVQPNSWDAKVEIIREFFHRYGRALSNAIDQSRPERYAANYEEIIRDYSNNLQQVASTLRRF